MFKYKLSAKSHKSLRIKSQEINMDLKKEKTSLYHRDFSFKLRSPKLSNPNSVLKMFS